MNKQSFLRILFVTATILGSRLTASACDACKAQQPKILQGITHGPGPGSNWDYFIVGVVVVIMLYSLFATVKCLISPAKQDREYNIKNIILKQEGHG
ncbi:MAG: hypothetical protein ACTHJ8_00375 [Mucilaginibacter sp.]